MNTVYKHNDLKKNWYKFWEKNKNFKTDYNKKQTYCITIPPPNITGKLHMGHAFQCTLIDILIRYYRMNNYSILWKMGCDHAGIATQILIEQSFRNKAKNETKKISKWRKKSIKNIRKQLKILGCSINWETERFTLDKHFSYAVKSAFIKLYNEKLIYKNKSLVNWDSKLKTAISDLETIYTIEHTYLYYIKYKINTTKKDYIIIATTRPETIFADSAIAVNPKDKRYVNLKNKKVKIPIINKTIPILFDDTVDINFGTGCLKITPAHDFKDFEIGEKYNLQKINILTKNAKLNTNVPQKYQNLNTIKARSVIEKNLLFFNLIQKIEKHESKIPRGDRSNNIIEPRLTEQWYVKVQPLAKPVLSAIKNKEIIILPEKWKKIFTNWIHNMKDWCISRQIWWGHKIPIWYDKKNNQYVGENEKSIKKKYNIKENIHLKQDVNVLDTWFSSALWPFASLGWPKETKEFKKFYPTNTLITGFDIIFFWVIRMIMFGLKFTEKLPFKEIYIHGLIRDKLGNKMSKTKGNVIDPSDIIYGITYKKLIEKKISNLLNDNIKKKIIETTKKEFPKGIKSFGVDPLRLALSSMATNNISMNLNLENVEKYKNFCNKLWNAAKFIKNTLEKNNETKKKNTSPHEIWITSIWQKTKKNIIQSIEKRNISFATNLIYKFVWDEFCNWFIEFTKIMLNSKKYSISIKKRIHSIFSEILITLHPFAPYITEEIWHTLNKSKSNLAISTYIKIHTKLLNKHIEKKTTLLKEICTQIRNAVKEKNIIVVILTTKYKEFNVIEKFKTTIKALLKLNKIYINYKCINEKKHFINISKYTKIILPYHKKSNNISLEKNLLKIEKIEKILKNKLFIKNAKKYIIEKKKKLLNELLKKTKNI